MNSRVINRSKWIRIVSICFITILISVVAFNLYIFIVTPKEYLIKSQNYFDYQSHYECSGYSSAYVLRSLGIDITGLDVYNNIAAKNKDGTVTFLNLVKALRKEGYNAKLHRGTLYQLKHEISKGTPVIAFVKISPEQKYYHFLPIVGYDKDEVYAAESLKYKVNSDNDYYNRIINNNDFKKMWDTGFLWSNTYITIRLTE